MHRLNNDSRIDVEREKKDCSGREDVLASCCGQGNEMKRKSVQLPLMEGSQPVPRVEVSGSSTPPRRQKSCVECCHVFHHWLAAFRVLLHSYSPNRRVPPCVLHSPALPCQPWAWRSGADRKCFQPSGRTRRSKGTSVWAWVCIAATVLAWCCPALAQARGCPVQPAPPNKSKSSCFCRSAIIVYVF